MPAHATLGIEPRTIRVAHSPDADDAFMFHALASGAVRASGLAFEHVLADIETLNEAARAGRYEVSAISFRSYPEVAGRYWLMACGASMGEGYGPLVVAASPSTRADLRGKRIAIPGLGTSAHLAARLWLDDIVPVPVRFDDVARAVLAGEAQAGVLIHEGQLTFREDGLHLVEDLGRAWLERTGLPLPLGGNIVRRDLGLDAARSITRAVRASIEHGLARREEALAAALRFGRGLDRTQADRFVGMYVNARTVDLGEDGLRAVRLFLALGHERGLLPPPPEIEVIR